MSGHIVNDFKDLRSLITAVTKANPAKTTRQQNEKKMGIHKEDEAQPIDDKKPKEKKFHAGEEEIKRAYLNLGRAAQGSLEYQRKLLQKELAKMGFKTYSQFAFDAIFKFEQKDKKKKWKEPLKGFPGNEEIDENIQLESALSDMQDIVKTKGAKKIGGVMVDMFTASVITNAYNKVSDANKKKLETANLQTLVKLAHKIMGMKEELNLDEGKMSDLLIDIQQGATAKELARDFNISLATAKNFLKDYYGQKKGSRKEEVEESVNESNWGFVFYNKKSLDNFLKDPYIKSVTKNVTIDKAKFRGGKSGFDVGIESDADLGLNPLAKKVDAIKKKYGKPGVDYAHVEHDGESISEGNSILQKDIKGRKHISDIEIRFDDEKEWKRMSALVKKELKKPAYKGVKDVYYSPDPLQIGFGDPAGKSEINLKPIVDLIIKQTKDPQTRLKSLAEDTVSEGTWLLPKGPKAQKDLKALLKKPIPLGKDGDSATDVIDTFIGDDSLLDDLHSAGKKNPNADARPIIKKAMKRLGIKEEVSREDKLKEEQEHAKQSPFKLKSQQYPRAIAIDIKGHGKRHATGSDITEACNSFGMITDKELQIEQIQKQLGKQGFISYTKSDLQDVFEERETERMIYALESITEEQSPIEYTKDQVEDSYIMSEEIEFVKPDGQKTAGPVLKLCENTFNVKDKYTGKSFTYKYINEENNVRTFRDITEGKFSAKLIKQAGGIAFDKRYYMGNMTGAIKAIEKLKKGLSDDPKVQALLKTANENTNNNFFEALSTEDKEAYQKFFNGALKKFGVSSPAELEGEKKKEFFDYIDKNWKGDGEKKEEVVVDEGKYLKYSDLLVKKARLVAQGPIASKEIAAVNKQIAAEMKKLGIKEDNINEVSIGDADIQRHFPNVWKQKDKRMNSILMALVNLHGYNDNLKSYKKDKKKFVDSLKRIGKNDASLKKAGLTKKNIGEKSRVDGRTTNFREKMRKLGYIKGPSFGNNS